MSEQTDNALKVLRSIEGTRTNAVKAAIAQVHATLAVEAAVRASTAEQKRQLAVIVRLWNE